jgi:hypothetical protein
MQTLELAVYLEKQHQAIYLGKKSGNINTSRLLYPDMFVVLK